MERIDVVIPAAGMGSRMGLSSPKQFSLLAKVPLIIHPLRVFKSLTWVGKLIIIHGSDQLREMSSILDQFGIQDCVLVEGGATRQESVRRGLAQVTSSKVVVHNAAVAIVTREEIEKVIAIDADCVTTASQLEVNLVKGATLAECAIPRHGLKMINSPQCFRTEVLRECHQEAFEQRMSFNSDAELMLHFKKTVHLVPALPHNFKITTPFDLMVAETILAMGALSPERAN